MSGILAPTTDLWSSEKHLDGVHGGYFEVTFFGYEGKPRTTKITASVYEELNDRQKKVIEILQARERITSAECMELFEVSKMTITRDLKALIELEIIETQGKGPGTYYVLNRSD